MKDLNGTQIRPNYSIYVESERIYILLLLLLFIFFVQMWKESCLVNISWWSHNSIEKKISKNEVWCRVINEIVKHL